MRQFFQEGDGSFSMTRLVLFLAFVCTFPPVAYIMVTTGKIPDGLAELGLFFGIPAGLKALQNTTENKP